MEDRWCGSWYELFVQPCLVELLGSALFIFIGCLSIIENKPEAGLLQTALAHELALGLIIATLGNISGGHFNPAVSLAAMLIGGLNLMMLLPFWISQLCGALIGVTLAKAGGESRREIPDYIWGSLCDSSGARAGGGAEVAELALTILLALAVCMGTIKKTQGPLAPFSTGFSITVDILAGFLALPSNSISFLGAGRRSQGGSLEQVWKAMAMLCCPLVAIILLACLFSGGYWMQGLGCYIWSLHESCRAFGLAVVANHWDFQWIYWLGPLLASLLVGVFIRFFIGDRKTCLILKGW